MICIIPFYCAIPFSLLMTSVYFLYLFWKYIISHISFWTGVVLFLVRGNHQITPPAQVGAEESVRLLLTKNPASSFSYLLLETRYLVWKIPVALEDKLIVTNTIVRTSNGIYSYTMFIICIELSIFPHCGYDCCYWPRINCSLLFT